MTVSTAASPRPEGMTTVLYKHYDAEDRPLYYGVSDNPDRRAAAHQYQSLWPKLSARATEEWFPSRAAAEEAERAAITADEPLFNRDHNTAGAEQRLVAYLAQGGLLDLLQPAWPRVVRQSRPVVQVSTAPQYYYDAELERRAYPGDQEVIEKPFRLRTWDRAAPALLLPADWLRARYNAMAEMSGDSRIKASEVDGKVGEILALQELMNDTTRDFEVLVGESLFTACGGGEDILRRLLEVSYRPNVKAGALVLGRRLTTFPPDGGRRIHDHIFILETMFGEEVEPSGRAARINNRHLDLLWPSAVTGDELRGLIERKLSGDWDGFFNTAGIADMELP